MYEIRMRSHGNIDHGENPFSPVAKGMTIRAETIAELQQAVRDYIDENNLGGGNFTHAFVADDRGIIGAIAYNGRFFTREEWNSKSYNQNCQI